MMRGMVWVVLVLMSVAAMGQAPAAKTSSRTSAKEQFDAWRRSMIDVYMNDFGQLSRYREANAALPPPAPGTNRVVFLGDSITDGWQLDRWFPSAGYINRGISGQTTSQMLVRVRQDVIDLQPKVVIILAGTNDIAGNTGPISAKDIEENYATIAELAKVHGITVIYSSVTPVNNYPVRSAEMLETRQPAEILELNRWLKDYCAANTLVYLDYFSAMVDDKGLLRRELSEDGLHPNDAGYAVMAPLAQAAINKALGGARPSVDQPGAATSVEQPGTPPTPPQSTAAPAASPNPPPARPPQ